MNKIIAKILIILIITTGCGFEIVKYSELLTFNINEIITTGDKKINYKLKRKLKNYSIKENNDLITIFLDTNKNKLIKEKDDYNTITKYEINLIINLRVESDIKKYETNFTLKKSTEFKVASNHSKTLKNESAALDILIDDLADDIMDKLLLEINDI